MKIREIRQAAHEVMEIPAKVNQALTAAFTALAVAVVALFLVIGKVFS